jgi:hypothetical protein
VARYNIFGNCVTPGPIGTDMIRNLGAESVAAMVDDSPMKRLGAADEVAHLVTWLCSEGSHFSAGAVFDMSGGARSLLNDAGSPSCIEKRQLLAAASAGGRQKWWPGAASAWAATQPPASSSFRVRGFRQPSSHGSGEFRAS